MKVYVKYIIITLLATLAVLSCKKNEPVLTEEPILMSFKEAGQTKALLNPTTFATEGNQLQIYDYYTPREGDPTYHTSEDRSSRCTIITVAAKERRYTELRRRCIFCLRMQHRQDLF